MQEKEGIKSEVSKEYLEIILSKVARGGYMFSFTRIQNEERIQMLRRVRSSDKDVSRVQ